MWQFTSENVNTFYHCWFISKLCQTFSLSRWKGINIIFEKDSLSTHFKLKHHFLEIFLLQNLGSHLKCKKRKKSSLLLYVLGWRPVFNGYKDMVHRWNKSNTRRELWIGRNYAIFSLFWSAISTFWWHFQRFRFPNFHVITNLSNKLVDCLAKMTSKRIHVHSLAISNTLFLLFWAYQHGHYLSNKPSRLHYASRNYRVITTECSVV